MKRIDELFCFAVVVDGIEGVPAMPKGAWLLPLMGADAARIESLRPIAQAIANAKREPVRLLRFSGREELALLTPDASAARIAEVSWLPEPPQPQ